MGRAIEIILMRQLASYLAVPTLVVDRELELLFFNESAEPILGRRFDETGGIHRGEWSAAFRPTDANGALIPRQEQVLSLAIDRRQPSHRRFWLTGLDGIARVIEALSFPLETREDGLLGATGIFWEVKERAVAPHAEEPEAKIPSHSRHPVEVVLLRRLVDRLLMPTMLIDMEGRLVFYNPAAEPLVGRRFEQLGPIEAREWYDAFRFANEDGSLIKRESHPMHLALRRNEPTFRRFLFQGLDGVKRVVEGTAFPLLGQCDRKLGAAAIFWEGAP